ncbi:cell cycle checkpoint control protein RAD9B isoform X3 [Betta splendens]|uniref:Cell cycle checkpoint control protein RAD9A n=1 Tax=Betta splendens TaxID=158456 RepID=A0A6P7NHT8_BETSP|nr:cell cycle checkpoint control protein RAD9B isoform X3 [Betta splendens]
MVLKSLLPLFRCLTSIERNVERCRISIGDRSDQVEIQFFCRHGITKTHSLRFQESEALQAVFASHLCPNVLKAPARLLSDMVLHFPVSQEEITLSTTHLKVGLRNYSEGGNDRRKMMCTQMFLHPDEFDSLQIGVDSDITFCLKELRGFLSFAESHFLQVSIRFGAAGKPVCFSVEDMVLEATVVLATLIDSDSWDSSQLNVADAPPTARCADAAELPVDLHNADSSNAADMTEWVASSQGSPTMHPPSLMQLLPQIYEPDTLHAPDKACDRASATPASTTICSLLFRALSSELDDGGCTSRLPVLACYSDMEEDMEDLSKIPSP